MRKKKRDTNRIVIQKMLGYCDDIERFMPQFKDPKILSQEEEAQPN